jgi:MFS family permease
MNEFQLGLVVAGQTSAQFLTVRFWSRKNERHGVVLPVTFGILGLSLCPLFMITAVSLPPAIGLYAFLIFHAASSLTLTTITLNMFQCLLQVADDEYRSFSISVFTCLTCFSNAIMPIAGVALYRALGGNISGMRYTYCIVFVLRIIAAGLWLLRWRTVKST